MPCQRRNGGNQRSTGLFQIPQYRLRPIQSLKNRLRRILLLSLLKVQALKDRDVVSNIDCCGAVKCSNKRGVENDQYLRGLILIGWGICHWGPLICSGIQFCSRSLSVDPNPHDRHCERRVNTGGWGWLGTISQTIRRGLSRPFCAWTMPGVNRGWPLFISSTRIESNRVTDHRPAIICIEAR